MFKCEVPDCIKTFSKASILKDTKLLTIRTDKDSIAIEMIVISLMEPNMTL